jgi:hypothetical protein
MDAAKYAAGGGNLMAYRCMRLLPFVAPKVSGLELLKANGWHIKAFLGRLDDSQIAIAQQPGGLPLGGCTPYQLECLNRAFMLGKYTYRGQSDAWKSYITDGTPAGLPGGGVVHLSINSGSAVLLKMKLDGGYTQDSYGSLTEAAEWLNQLAPNGKETAFHLAGLVPQESQSFVFRFEFPGEVSRVDELKDYRPTAKEAKTLDELPEPLRSDLKSAMEKQAKK